MSVHTVKTTYTSDLYVFYKNLTLSEKVFVRTGFDICHLGQLEAKIYSQTDTLSDTRLQRSKHGKNSDRSSEQQDMQSLG